MAKRALFSVLGVVLGIVAGMIFMMSLHMASTNSGPDTRNIGAAIRGKDILLFRSKIALVIRPPSWSFAIENNIGD